MLVYMRNEKQENVLKLSLHILKKRVKEMNCSSKVTMYGDMRSW